MPLMNHNMRDKPNSENTDNILKGGCLKTELGSMRISELKNSYFHNRNIIFIKFDNIVN
jgi:hypothetical protein